MRPVDKHPELRNMLKVLRIITFMLISGVLFFFGVVWFKDLATKDHEGTPLLTYLAAGAAVVAVFVFLFVRLAQVRAARDKYARGDVPGFVGGYQAATIVWFAGLEGPAFFNGVAWMVEGQTLSPIVAGALVLLMIASIPTQDRVNNLLEAVP